MSDLPAHPDSDLPDRGPENPPSRDARPSGEAGGHTVQDWEQPAGQRANLSDALERQHHSTGPGLDDIDEPSPPTVPLYLRSATKAVAREAPEAVPASTARVDARTQILTAQSAAIVDAITKALAEALAASLRPVVASTVVSMLPMLLSLGSVPEDEWPDAARPSKGTPARP